MIEVMNIFGLIIQLHLFITVDLEIAQDKTTTSKKFNIDKERQMITVIIKNDIQ